MNCLFLPTDSKGSPENWLRFRCLIFIWGKDFIVTACELPQRHWGWGRLMFPWLHGGGQNENGSGCEERPRLLLRSLPQGLWGWEPPLGRKPRRGAMRVTSPSPEKSYGVRSQRSQWPSCRKPFIHYAVVISNNNLTLWTAVDNCSHTWIRHGQLPAGAHPRWVWGAEAGTAGGLYRAVHRVPQASSSLKHTGPWEKPTCCLLSIYSSLCPAALWKLFLLPSLRIP